MFRRTLSASLPAALLVALAAGTPATAAPADEIELQILGLNDFHGHLTEEEAPGGAAYLKSQVEALRAGQEHTATVHAGDMIGGSPFLSAAFRDEPAVEAMNEIGLTAAAVGNHEFDRGQDELLRMVNGGCLDDGDGEGGRNSCPLPGKTYGGADFPMLSANVTVDATGETLLPPYVIEEYDGVKVAYVGIGLDQTPSVVTAQGIEGLTFDSSVETANALVPELQEQGVEAMVMVAHEGGEVTEDGEFVGDMADIMDELDPAYDVVISGHTHQLYVVEAGGRVVSQAGEYGEHVTDIDLRLDPATGDVVPGSVQAENVEVTHDVQPDATVEQLVAEYEAVVGPVADEVLGTVAEQVSHDRYASAVSPLGRMIADAQLADESVVHQGKTPEIAFMNPGGIRVPELDENGDGEVTMEEAFTAQPFNNYMVSMDLTGAQIHDLLEAQWQDPTYHKFLQTSTGFTYAVTDMENPELVAGSVELDGETIADDDSQTYRIVTNNFLAGGGDDFAAFTEGKNVYFGGLDIDAFRAYLEASSPYTPVDPQVPTIGEPDEDGPIIDTGYAPTDLPVLALLGGTLVALGAGTTVAGRRNG
ncbi:5'-nucleotidase [Kytococcus aerolatus]|uniref:5'-nucleotidase n=1 Tax=Kytococcus aerolatus TaxID=592308 RepID=A0A212U7Y2_9MICO|nr:bifunctional metallophosphatase/5'-nucleotidase [Kytococcus aerolatus]SNC74326.1 5'-nucleotidase [Kytococcus aerolatus]